MVYVRMLRHLTGGRYDGQEWPGYLGLIDVPEWEAENLVRQGYAESPDAPELDRGYNVLKVPDPDYESHLKRADGVEEEEDPRYVHQSEEETDYDSDFERDDGDNDFEREEITPPVKRPYTSATKAEWIKYAVYLGANRLEVMEMTKNALIEKFGS